MCGDAARRAHPLRPVGRARRMGDRRHDGSALMAARIDRARFNAAIRAPMNRLLQERLERAGERAVDIAEEIIGQTYDNDRDPQRRRNAVPLAGSMYHVMLDTDPPTLAVRSRAPHANILN